MSDYGPKVSRVIPVKETSYVGSLHLKLHPSVDAMHNFDNDAADHNSRSRLSQLLYSGVTNFKAANKEDLFIPTLDPNFVANDGKNPNEFGIQNFDAVVNGWVIPVRSSMVTGGSLSDMDYITLELSPAPAPAPALRQDLIILEVWRAVIEPPPSTKNKPDPAEVYRHGNTQFRGANLPDDLIQPGIPATSGLRIQVQHRLRVIEGVNFKDHPDGLTDPIVKSHGYTFQRDFHDTGLYVAGDGSQQAVMDMDNADGFVYAIPICKIHRRNTSRYSLSNPNGSEISIMSTSPSDRPDGLFYDEISIRDIVDLRHRVWGSLDPQGILEHNFDLLLRRKLRSEFGVDTRIHDQIQGTEMLTVDGYSLTDRDGVYDLPFKPDGIRRDYSGESRSHEVWIKFDPANDYLDNSAGYNANTFSYNSTTYEISISLPAGSTFDSAPIFYKDGILQANPLTSGWNGNAHIRTGELDPSLNGEILIYFEASYAPAGHRFVANRYLKVENNHSIDPMEWSYTVNPENWSDYREIFRPGLDSGTGFVNTLRDYPIVTIDSAGVTHYRATPHTEAYTQIMEYHLAGNPASTIYHIPKDLFSNEVSVLGIRRVTVTDASAVNWIDHTPASVTRVSGGQNVGFQVQMQQSFGVDKVLKFELILQRPGTVLDRSTKGLKEIFALEEIEVDGDGTDTYTFVASGPVQGISSYLDGNTTKYCALLDNTRSDQIQNVSVSRDQIEIQFTTNILAGTKIRIYALVGYAPKADDRIDIFYDRQAYQGIQATNVNIDGSKILAVGKNPLLHSVGTHRDTEIRNREAYAVSETLPLAVNVNDSDFRNANLSLDFTQFNSFQFLRLPHTLTHDYRITSEGKLPSAGDVIRLKPDNVKPERGIQDALIYLENDLNDDNYPIEFITPKLTNSEYHQIAMYYLIQDVDTKELLMLVLTYSSNQNGNELVKSNSTLPGVAYDVFRLNEKPLLK